jgi:excisionase family DNA binding protein
MRVRLRPNGKFLTLRQAEAEYALPYARLYEWVREGKLPHLDDGKRSWLIQRADLDKFISGLMTAVR